MTLDDLSTAWNNLRNAALGRGVVPLVPQALANEVGTSYEQWRAFLASAGPVQDMLPSAPTSAAYPWLQKYRQLAAKVQAAGVQFTQLPEQAIESFGNVASKTLTTVGLAFVAIGFPLAVLIVLNKAK